MTLELNMHKPLRQTCCDNTVLAVAAVEALQ